MSEKQKFETTTIRDNILLFPRHKKESPEHKLSDKEMKIAMEAQVRLFSQQLKDVAMDDLFDLLNKNSLSVNSVNMNKDLAFVAEAIKSLIYRDFKLSHPIQKIVDNSVSMEILNGIPAEPLVNYKNIMVKQVNKPTEKKDEVNKEIP